MSKKQENLTHEEMWDDSALIDSWNEALQEYKKYHSIHAKGGSLRDLEPQSQVEAEPEPKQPQTTETQENVLISERDEENKIPSSRNESKEPAPSQSQGVPAFPIQTVLGSVQDESLKKLLMSWYYAGYYTGLYEGQQQAQQNHAS
ncbi:uncharacterized protein B0J16DRAFT_350793 [Fusarium flagelliforme]|uniref:Survival motor neuron-like protein 1 n=1 Tax=Fusarium flagelliforme TaxID=2675880 RepID=A0A395MXB5_9HYPO|nr:uncharacterized protein B0J16DRAFT_350793 [Fusarium flagelliforme]KAH7173743.1 hypothetical protein B0J16DRAFT_350793 [Fusarium flagelliforme]RFN52568.1 survival motor neuron-like protein 1 [Fusarium flagelliforme]